MAKKKKYEYKKNKKKMFPVFFLKKKRKFWGPRFEFYLSESIYLFLYLCNIWLYWAVSFGCVCPVPNAEFFNERMAKKNPKGPQKKAPK